MEKDTTPVTPATPDLGEIEKRAKAQERARAAEIRSIGKLGQLTEDEIQKAIDDEIAPEQFRKAAFENLARTTAKKATPENDTPHVEVTRDNGDTLRKRAVDCLAFRYAPASLKGERAADIQPWGIQSVMRELLVQEGHRSVHTLSNAQVVNQCLTRSANHTTSLLSNIALDAANKFQIAGRDIYTGVWRQLSNTRTVSDFKTINTVALATAGHLAKVNENGEYPEDVMKDSRETYAPDQRGQILSITYKMLVNDDLGALASAAARQAANAERTLDMLFFSVLRGTGGVGKTMSDTAALFSTTHSNYTSTGTAMSVASLQVGEGLMAKQTDENGNVLGVMPTILLCSTDKAATARQLLDSQYDPATTGNPINPFLRRFTPVASAHLAAGFTFDGTAYTAAPNAWYLFANPQLHPVMELCAIDGQFTPRIVADEEFNTMGLKLRTTFEVGATAVDWRGAYLNVGA